MNCGEGLRHKKVFTNSCQLAWALANRCSSFIVVSSSKGTLKEKPPQRNTEHQAQKQSRHGIRKMQIFRKTSKISKTVFPPPKMLTRKKWSYIENIFLFVEAAQGWTSFGTISGWGSGWFQWFLACFPLASGPSRGPVLAWAEQQWMLPEIDVLPLPQQCLSEVCQAPLCWNVARPRSQEGQDWGLDFLPKGVFFRV